MLVIAGAGMGVDSGLHTFRVRDGTYTLADYHSKCRHELFVKDPQAAWEFHGPVLQRFREAVPHQGFQHLLRICQKKGAHYVVTSNVDEQFQKAGFPASRVFNAHGTVHLWQCMKTRCNLNRDPWLAGTWRSGELPRCRHCKTAVARPNVSLFDDNLDPYSDSFNARILERQYAGFENWLRQVRARRATLCIVEVGCGVSEHSLRLVPERGGRWSFMSEEWDLKPLSSSLIRIDPVVANPTPERQCFVHIVAGAAAALEALAAAVGVLTGSSCISSGPPVDATGTADASAAASSQEEDGEEDDGEAEAAAHADEPLRRRGAGDGARKGPPPRRRQPGHKVARRR